MILTALLLASGWSLGGTAQVASQIKTEYETAMQRWAMRLQTAMGNTAREAVVKDRPVADEFARRMWVELQPSLHSK